MNYKKVGQIVAWILAVEGAFMIPPTLICLFDHQYTAAMSFSTVIALVWLVCGILLLLSRRPKKTFRAREGMFCVAISWIFLSLFGCLPFYFSREIPRFIDALFEIVSGFTTTGASVVPDVEALSRGMLFWRSFSHWLGGMGVLVFVLAILPISGRNDGFTMHLLRAESPGPTVSKLVPRMRSTASILYLLYIILTVVDIVFLLVGGMPLFDALCIAFGTAGTGGFGIRSSSIAEYSPYIQNVCTVFMFLFGVNFSCFYLLILGRIRDILRDEELHFYFLTAVGSAIVIAVSIRRLYGTLGETLRHAFFQVSSVMTTTGYATTDFDQWPSFAKAILLCLMVIGACGGSTGGGIKCSRVILLMKGLLRNIRQSIHPTRVETVRVNRQIVQEKVLDNTNAYLSAYVIFIVLSTILISVDGFSFTTNFSAVLACFNNIGPGLEAVGPTCSFVGYSVFSKCVLIVDMLAGRLEIFPILALCTPHIWKRK